MAGTAFLACYPPRPLGVKPKESFFFNKPVPPTPTGHPLLPPSLCVCGCVKFFGVCAILLSDGREKEIQLESTA